MATYAFLLGFAGSFHCLGMCAPIFWAVMGKTAPRWQPLAYHGGRVAAYALMGGLIGLAGKAFLFTGWQQGLSYFSGAVFVVLGLFAVNLDTFMMKVPGMKKIYEGLSSLMGKLIQGRGGLATLGFLNGFLPCGLAYMALFGALATGDAASGAFYMLAFGAGTLPLMLGAAYTSLAIKPIWRGYAKKAYPLLFVCIGMLMLYRGYQIQSFQGRDTEQGQVCVP